MNVRNVAQTVIRQAYAIYGFDGGQRSPGARDRRGTAGPREAARTAPTSER